MENKWLKYGIVLVVGILVVLCFSVVCCSMFLLLFDILVDDWWWMYVCGVFLLVVFVLLIFFFLVWIKECFLVVVLWVFILYGGMEVVWGICQVYGFIYFNYFFYVLIGLFYNFGFYLGYFVMIFFICLYEWLKWKEGKKIIFYYVVLVVMLLIFCVLFVGMSCLVWIVVVVFFIYVCGMYYKMEIQYYIRYYCKQVVFFVIVIFILGGIVLGGIY